MLAQSGAGQPAAGVPMDYLAAMVVMIIAAVIAIAAALIYRGKNKK
jgi:hypothetical protein